MAKKDKVCVLDLVQLEDDLEIQYYYYYYLAYQLSALLSQVYCTFFSQIRLVPTNQNATQAAHLKCSLRVATNYSIILHSNPLSTFTFYSRY